MNTIVALGPNPAWQKTLFFKEFHYGKVNRAEEMQAFPAGKGINFCRAAACHGRTKAVLIQFTGGENGDRIRRELEREGMPVRSILTGGPTRSCTTCLDRARQVMTEVIEPSFAATSEEVEEMLAAFQEELNRGAAGAALCGTLPTGTDPDLYPRAAQLVRRAGIPLLLDSFRNTRDVFESGAEVWYKVNREELREMTGEPEVTSGLRQVFRFPAVKYAAITDGPDNAYASDGRTLAVYHLPTLPEVVNPIGCGDTANAIWMSEILAGSDLFEAFRHALAAASANCLTAFPGSFSPEEAEKIAAEITVDFAEL